MKKIWLLSLIFVGCTHDVQLSLLGDLSQSLNEVSGNEKIGNSDFVWMINDSGNKPEIFGVNEQGVIKRVVKVTAKNRDWEDLTSDKQGNLYIGDFGNNHLKRKTLHILKINNQDLLTKNEVSVSKISFVYPEEILGRKHAFDAEAFFLYQNNFYIFSKSREKKHLGKTLLFKVPNSIGKHKAVFMSQFTFENSADARITAADISEDGQTVALLNHKEVFLITNFQKDQFFKGQMQSISLAHVSQKEGVCFKDGTTLFITDEYSKDSKGNLYAFSFRN